MAAARHALASLNGTADADAAMPPLSPERAACSARAVRARCSVQCTHLARAELSPRGRQQLCWTSCFKTHSSATAYIAPPTLRTPLLHQQHQQQQHCSLLYRAGRRARCTQRCFRWQRSSAVHCYEPVRARQARIEQWSANARLFRRVFCRRHLWACVATRPRPKQRTTAPSVLQSGRRRPAADRVAGGWAAAGRARQPDTHSPSRAPLQQPAALLARRLLMPYDSLRTS